MEVVLKNKKTVVVAPAITKEIQKATIVRIVDLPVEKKIRAFVREIGRPLELTDLSGEKYGDWDDKDVASAVLNEISKL